MLNKQLGIVKNTELVTLIKGHGFFAVTLIPIRWNILDDQMSGLIG